MCDYPNYAKGDFFLGKDERESQNHHVTLVEFCTDKKCTAHIYSRLHHCKTSLSDLFDSLTWSLDYYIKHDKLLPA